MINATLASLANQARQAFVEQFVADGQRYHDSPAGTEVKINCAANCGGGK
jgi:hypothetical protein